ncbi:MAG TPA: type VI secretion system tube protein Hcp [Xanthobacteraceae bacterium]|nr:type VI secretion system tube protein Hcp [Xanthobacteraceae bacterium]
MAKNDILLEIKEIEGESGDQTYKNAMEIMSFSLSAQNDTTFDRGQGGGKGKVSLGHLNITKWHDKASAPLFNKCCAGDHFAKAVLHVRKQTGEKGKGLEYLKITLEKCAISSYSTGSHSGSDHTENCTIAFQKIKMETKMQDGDGKEKSGPEATYDHYTGEAA